MVVVINFLSGEPPPILNSAPHPQLLRMRCDASTGYKRWLWTAASQQAVLLGGITFAKTLGPSIGERLQLRRPDNNNYDDRSCHEHCEGRDYSWTRSPRDVTHSLALY